MNLHHNWAHTHLIDSRALNKSGNLLQYISPMHQQQSLKLLQEYSYLLKLPLLALELKDADTTCFTQSVLFPVLQSCQVGLLYEGNIYF